MRPSYTNPATINTTTSIHWTQSPAIWCSRNICNLSSLSGSNFVVRVAEVVSRIAKAIFATALFVPSIVLGLLGELALPKKVTLEKLEFEQSSTQRNLKNLFLSLFIDTPRSIWSQEQELAYKDFLENTETWFPDFLISALAFNKLSYLNSNAVENYGRILERKFPQLAFFNNFIANEQTSLDTLPSKKELLSQGKSLLAFPLVVQGSLVKHAMLIFVDINKNQIEFYDSRGLTAIDYGTSPLCCLDSQYPSDLIIKLKSLFLEEGATLVENTTKHQYDHFNCAVYISDYCWRRCTGESVKDIHNNGRTFSDMITTVRPRIIQEFLDEARIREQELNEKVLEYLVLQFQSLDNDKVRNNPNIALKALAHNVSSLSNLGEKLKSDSQFFAAAVQQNGLAIQFASDSIRNNPDIMLKAIKNDPNTIEFLGEKLQGNESFFLDLVTINGLYLEYASEELKDNPKVALTAFKNTPEALYHIGKQLQANRTFFLQLVAMDGTALQYAGDFRNDSEIALSAFNSNTHALAYIGNNLKSNANFFLEAIAINVIALHYANQKLKADYTFMLAAVQRNVESLKFASNSLKNDRNLIFAVVQMDPRVIEFASTSLQMNEEFLLDAIQRNPRIYAYINKTLRQDENFFLRAFQLKPKVIQFASERITSSKNLMLKLTKNYAEAFQYAADVLKSDFAYIQRLVSKNGLVLKFVEPRFKNDPIIAEIAARQNLKALDYVTNLELKAQILQKLQNQP